MSGGEVTWNPDDLDGKEIVAEFKRWWHSKTVLYNLVSLIPPAFVLLEQHQDLVASFTKPKFFFAYIVVIHLLNILLRRITSQAIK